MNAAAPNGLSWTSVNLEHTVRGVICFLTCSIYPNYGILTYQLYAPLDFVEFNLL